MTKNQEVSVLSEEQLAILNENFPQSDESNKVNYPKFGMLSKDLVEESGTGKNKKIEVIQAAGTFYTEKDLGETDAEGRKIWTKNFIDSETVDGIIPFYRYQLKKFDASLNKFISSPIYDSEDQVLSLFLDKQVIKKGTEKELQSLYPALTAKGKPTSDLKKYTIIYFIYEGETYQFNLAISSGWNFSTYKKSINPSTVITTLGSIEDTFGTNTYRKVTFTKKGSISPEDFNVVVENQNSFREQAERAQQLSLSAGDADNKFEKFNDKEEIPFD
jgi:hypothetical protein